MRTRRGLYGHVDGSGSGRLLVLQGRFLDSLLGLLKLLGLSFDFDGLLGILCRIGFGLELGLVMMLVNTHVLGEDHRIIEALDGLLAGLVDLLIEREVQIGNLHLGNSARLGRIKRFILDAHLLELHIVKREGTRRHGVEMEFLGCRVGQHVKLFLG